MGGLWEGQREESIPSSAAAGIPCPSPARDHGGPPSSWREVGYCREFLAHFPRDFIPEHHSSLQAASRVFKLSNCLGMLLFFKYSLLAAQAGLAALQGIWVGISFFPPGLSFPLEWIEQPDGYDTGSIQVESPPLEPACDRVKFPECFFPPRLSHFPSPHPRFSLLSFPHSGALAFLLLQFPSVLFIPLSFAPSLPHIPTSSPPYSHWFCPPPTLSLFSSRWSPGPFLQQGTVLLCRHQLPCFSCGAANVSAALWRLRELLNKRTFSF